jgi:hypothetical protein
MDTALAIPTSQLGKGRRQANSAPIRRRRRWSLEEDKALVTLIMQYGTKNWKFISDQMIGRTPRQCRWHWNFVFGLNRESWTREEDAFLMQLVDQQGHNWKGISSKFPKRTDGQVRNRWFYLSKINQRQNQPQINNRNIPVSSQFLGNLDSSNYMFTDATISESGHFSDETIDFDSNVSVPQSAENLNRFIWESADDENKDFFL